MEHRGHAKAVRFEQNGGPDVLQIVDVPVSKPGPGQVLVRVHAVGLNNVEAAIRAGYIPIPPPIILGTDGAGVVEEVGSGDIPFKKGDRVAIFAKNPTQNGTYTQYFLAEPDMLFHLPEKFTFQDGASLGIPFLTAYANIVIHANGKAGDVVLINGASGAVGLFGIEIGKALGCQMIGVAGNEEGLAMITKKGAVAISYKDPDFVKKVKDAAGPKGVDIIIETQSKNLPKDLEVLGKGGRICLIGQSRPQEIDFGVVLSKQLTIKGTQNFGIPPENYKLMRAGLEKALKDGSIHPVIQKVYPLDQVAKAHEDLTAGRGAVGKLILDMS